MYYKLGTKDTTIYKHGITMGDMEKSVLVGNFREGITLYRVCLEDNFIADQAVSMKSLEYLTNCLNIHTAWDYHSLMGWVFAGMAVGLLVFVIYMQRDKMEILYFHTPFYIYEKPQVEEEGEEGGEDGEDTHTQTDSENRFDEEMGAVGYQELESSTSYHTTPTLDELDILREKVRKVTFHPDT